jgi:hypothetical protein
MNRSYSGLVGTLDFNQGAPVVFLFLEKGMIDVFGDSEYVLRFIPFVVSIAALVLFLAVARALLSRTATVLALFLFATIEPLVYYASEAKQYGVDVAIGLLLLLLATRLFPKVPRGRALLPIAVVGFIAPWLSHASVFFLAGIGVVAIVIALRARDLGSLAQQGIVYALWLLSFGVEYVLSIRHLHQLEVLVTSGHATPSSNVVKGLYVIFSDPGQLPRTIVGTTAVLAAAGAVALWRRRPDLLFVIATTSTIAVLAGLQHRYPVGQRFILFLLPLAILLVAAGTVEIVSSLRRPLSIVVAAAIACLIFIPPAATATKHLVRPPDVEPAQSLISYVADNWRRGDTLYLFQESQYAFRYYLSCHDCNSDTEQRREQGLWPFVPAHGSAQTAPAVVSRSRSLVVGTGTGDLLQAYRGDLQKLRDRGRVWLLFTHYWPLEQDALMTPLEDASGRNVKTIRKGSAVLVLHDFGR